MNSPDFRKLPAFCTFIPLASGIFLSYYFDLKISQFENIYFFTGLILLALFSVFIYRKVINLYSLQFAIYFIFVFVFGFVSMQFKYYNLDENSIYRNIDSLKNNNTLLCGIVSDEPDIKDNRIKITLDADSLMQSGTTYNLKGTVLVTVYKGRFNDKTAENISYGDHLEVNGKIEALPHRRNPGEFDYGEYLKMHDVDGVFTSFGYDKIKKSGEPNPDFINSKIMFPVKDYINKIVEQFSEGDEREFLKGLLLGEKSNLSNETKQNFVNAGVAHIIAVSGLNVAYVLIVINGILLLLPVSRTVKIWLIIPCLIFYMVLTGNSASIVRATVMAIAFLLSQLFERKSDSYNVIAFSAIVIVLIDPRQLFDSGFILSFSAITAIVHFNPKLEAIAAKSKWYAGLNDEKKFNKYIKESISLFIVSLAAQIGTIPVTAVMFNKISVVSLIANMVAIPVSNINLAIGFITVLFSTFSSVLAEMFSSANNFLMHYLLKFVALCANFDFSYIETYRVDVLLFLIYYVLIFLIFSVNRVNYKSRLAIILLIVINFAVFKSILTENNNVKLSYLDVGNSNCTLISLPQGTNIMVNTGTSSAKYNSAERNIIPFLKAEGIKQINLLVITSIDADEFRNLKFLLGNFSINKIMLPVYYKSLFNFTYLSRAFDKVPIEFIDSSQIINQKGKFRIYLSYDKTLKGESMMAQFIYGNQRFIFDDAETDEEDFVNYKAVSDSAGTSVLRLPLTGSFAYTSGGFIVKAAPGYAVISSSKGSRRKLSTEVFAASLKSIGIDVLKINETGAAIFETDGTNTKLVNWK